MASKDFSVKNFLLKYLGLVFTVLGSALMLFSIRSEALGLFETFPTSLIAGFSGLLLFFAGTILMAKGDEDFMEKIIEKVGKILKLFS